MSEVWKPVYQFEHGYEVSNLGRVRSIPREVNSRFTTRTISQKILKQYADKDGYLHVNLRKSNRYFRKRVSRLVAESFIGIEPFLCEVNHRDENVNNNTLSNLEWCDRTYNNNYGTRNDRVSAALSKAVIAENCEGGRILFSSVASTRQS